MNPWVPLSTTSNSIVRPRPSKYACYDVAHHELEVRLPDRRSASSFSTSKKPMAEVSCIMDNGRSREIVVPVRVGRLLMTDAIGLPLPEEEAFDAIDALEGKICFAQLTEVLSRRDMPSSRRGNDYSITDIVRSKSMRPIQGNRRQVP